MSELRHHLFSLSGNKDAHLLLALVVCLTERQTRHPNLGPVVGIAAWELEDFIESRQAQGAIHPSVDARLISDGVRGCLTRLKRAGLVRNTSRTRGEPNVWRPSPDGERFLSDRKLFKPEPGERRR